MASVLVVTREPPYPPNAGDRIVTFGFVRALVERGHDVHLLTYDRDGSCPAALRSVCESVTVVSQLETRLPPRARKLRHLLTLRSDVMGMFDSTALRDGARRAIRSLAPDAVLAQHPYVGQIFRDDEVRRALRAADSRAVTNAHVVEYAAHERYRRMAEERNRRLELALEVPRLRREELAAYDAADRTLVLGAEDRAELVGRVSGPVRHQHVGLDVAEYAPSERGESNAKRLLFFGSYGWFPNRDAATHLVERILPEIRNRCPDAELALVGRGATEEIRELGERPGVSFVGEVENLDGWVRDASVVVAPLRIGGGTRLKILESMAWGTPVVTTPAGFEGVDARSRVDVAVAETPESFAAATAALLNSAGERRRLGRNARRRIERLYSIRAAGDELESNLGLAERE